MGFVVGFAENLLVPLAHRRHYQQQAGIDEKFAMLQCLERTKRLGVVKALGYEVGDAYEGTDDGYAKRVLAEKILGFEANGWTDRFYAVSALASLIGSYCSVTVDPAESLRMFLDVWYPKLHSWAMWGLDFRLRTLMQYQLARTIGWTYTHERAFESLCQRIEGKGELAYGSPMKDTKDISEAFTYVKFLEMKQALIEKVQTTEDATARKVYEDALAEWIKRNEK
jgi:hypothetical protein